MIRSSLVICALALFLTGCECNKKKSDFSGVIGNKSKRLVNCEYIYDQHGNRFSMCNMPDGSFCYSNGKGLSCRFK